MDFPPRRRPGERQRVNLDIEFAPLREPRSRDEPPAARAGEPGAPRGRSETLARIGWALPWIAAIVVAITVGGLLFAAAMAAFACVGLEELFRMGRDARPFEIVAFEASWRRLAAVPGRTINAFETVALWSSTPSDERTLSVHVVAAAAVGARVNLAFAGKTFAIPSMVQVPPRPTIVAGLTVVAAKPFRTRTRTIVAGLRVPAVVPA